MALAAALAMLAGCQADETDCKPDKTCDNRAAPHIVGLTLADAATLRLSPGGGALSVLYDDFVVRGQKSGPEKRLDQTRRLTIVASKPARVTIDVRGEHLGDPAGAGELVLNGGGDTATLALAGMKDINWRTTVPLEESTPLSLTARFPAAQAEQAEIHIDSIDIAVVP